MTICGGVSASIKLIPSSSLLRSLTLATSLFPPHTPSFPPIPPVPSSICPPFSSSLLSLPFLLPSLPPPSLHHSLSPSFSPSLLPLLIPLSLNSPCFFLYFPSPLNDMKTMRTICLFPGSEGRGKRRQARWCDREREEEN